MQIIFTGKQQKLTPTQERKLAMQFGKLSKLLERRGEKEVQVVLSTERHLCHAEMKIEFHGQSLVASGSDTDQFTAVMEAAQKLEKQAIKTRTKFRDIKRDTPSRAARVAIAPEVLSTPIKKVKKGKATPVAAAPKPISKPAKVVKANSKSNGKPMTVDEAMLTMGAAEDYMVYRDAETDKVSVLIRRRDGKVDLVEA